jgi:hypothetical protein
LHAALTEATEVGLVRRAEDGYAFCHDRIREAAYALVPEDERAAVHLRIGRLLLPTLAAGDASDRIFDIVNQLNRGANLVASSDERLQIAELNLTAARRARAVRVPVGLDVPGRRESAARREHWEGTTGSGSPWPRACQCEFLTGELPAADERLLRLKERARVGKT